MDCKERISKWSKETQETAEVVPATTILYGLNWRAGNGCGQEGVEIRDVICEQNVQDLLIDWKWRDWEKKA